MTLAFWHAGKLDEAARAVRDWARVDSKRPAPHRFAARIYEDMGAIDLAAEAAERAAGAGPETRGRGSGWGGCACAWPTARALCGRSSGRSRWEPGSEVQGAVRRGPRARAPGRRLAPESMATPRAGDAGRAAALAGVGDRHRRCCPRARIAGAP